MRPGRYFEVMSEKSCSHFALSPRSSAIKKVPLSIEPTAKSHKRPVAGDDNGRNLIAVKRPIVESFAIVAHESV